VHEWEGEVQEADIANAVRDALNEYGNRRACAYRNAHVYQNKVSIRTHVYQNKVFDQNNVPKNLLVNEPSLSAQGIGGSCGR
jgi:hypothetical protein